MTVVVRAERRDRGNTFELTVRQDHAAGPILDGPFFIRASRATNFRNRR